MSIYSNSAFGPPFKNIARLSTQIEPNYFFGSRDYKTEPFTFSISEVAYASGTATLTVQLQNGGGPSYLAAVTVGAKMGVRGTTTDGGVLNVDPTTVTSSTVNAQTGAGTISYALTADGVISAMSIDVAGTGWAVNDTFSIAGGTGGVGKVTAEAGGIPSAISIVSGGSGYSDTTGALTTAILPSVGTGLTVTITAVAGTIVTTPDTGTLVVQSAELPDLVAAGTASAPYALVFTPDESDNSRCLGAEVKWGGTMPSAATVVLQGANVDDESRYMTIGNVQGCAPGAIVATSAALATIAGSVVTQSGALYSFVGIKFIRAKVLSMSGGDGTTSLICTVFG